MTAPPFGLMNFTIPDKYETHPAPQKELLSIVSEAPHLLLKQLDKSQSEASEKALIQRFQKLTAHPHWSGICRYSVNCPLMLHFSEEIP